jgi:hypothetical protein
MFQWISCALFEQYLYIFSREMAVNLTTLSLARGINAGLWVCPRWPSRHVQVEANVLFYLQRIQEKLPVEIELILTRGYEPQSSTIGFARTLFRSLGIGLFSTLYPNRSNEISEIFGSNGHDIDGTHIDISFRINGRRIRMLPLGVFTPLAWQQRRIRKYAHYFSLVCDALRREGFKIHRNPTEALQIHCDMIKEADQK